MCKKNKTPQEVKEHDHQDQVNTEEGRVEDNRAAQARNIIGKYVK